MVAVQSGAYFLASSSITASHTSNALAATDSFKQAALAAPSTELDCEEKLSNANTYNSDPYGHLLVSDCEREKYAATVDSGPSPIEQFVGWLGEKSGLWN